MNRQKQQNLYRYGICLVILCLCTCIVLATGVTYARYRTEFLTQSFNFKSQLPQSIYLHGEVTSELQEQVQGGDWPDCPVGWTVLEHDDEQEEYQADAELRFSISNGESRYDFASRNQECTVQVVASLSVEDPNDLTIRLTAEDPEDASKQVHYLAVPERILEGSFLYDTYGDGWIYRFVDEKDEQLMFQLKGGCLSYSNFVIDVAGNVPPSLLSLEISGQYTQSE